MHACELVELAALVSAHGPALVRSPEAIPPACIERYWAASKVRLDHWASQLKALANRDARNDRQSDAWAVLEEILTGEMLTRVWTATLCAYDKRRGSDEAEPVARSVMIGHMEARHRVLTLMAGRPNTEEAANLNRLRLRIERWTDLLVGHLVAMHDVSEFAFDADRARDFAVDLGDRSRRPDGRLVWPMLRASLRTAFQHELARESPNADLNARIAGSVLGCFPAAAFDSTGLPSSLWLMQVMNSADDTQVMLDDLLAPALSCPPIHVPRSIPPRIERRRLQ